ncbi:hypothetical protein DW085_13060 [Clostridium sp. AF50-3]|nr:hypothetical protein DW085_13060 [Clostridium sp. AF50-3]
MARSGNWPCLFFLRITLFGNVFLLMATDTGKHPFLIPPLSHTDTEKKKKEMRKEKHIMKFAFDPMSTGIPFSRRGKQPDSQRRVVPVLRQ